MHTGRCKCIIDVNVMNRDFFFFLTTVILFKNSAIKYVQNILLAKYKIKNNDILKSV